MCPRLSSQPIRQFASSLQLGSGYLGRDRRTACTYETGLRPILLRSLHLPVAVVEGSLTENPNRTGVRLWTESFRQSLCRSDGDSRQPYRSEIRSAFDPIMSCSPQFTWRNNPMGLDDIVIRR